MTPTEFLDRKFASGKPRHCWMCGCVLNRFTASVDHLKPQAYGGKDRPENFKLACKQCNSARGCSTISRQQIAFLKGREKRKAPDHSALSKAIKAHAKNSVA